VVISKSKFEIFTNIKSSQKFKNCKIHPIQRDDFESSIRNSHGVITSAGFQTPSESLFLGKN
jgi:hypothetical protein